MMRRIYPNLHFGFIHIELLKKLKSYYEFKVLKMNNPKPPPPQENIPVRNVPPTDDGTIESLRARVAFLEEEIKRMWWIITNS